MIAALFPGQGSQRPGMGKDLYQNFRYVRTLVEEAEDIFQTHLWTVMQGDDEQALQQSSVAQPALFIVSIALMEVLSQEFGWAPHQWDAMAGHSLGEYSALCASQALTPTQTLGLLAARCAAMAQAPQGGMVAVLGASQSDIQACLDTLDPVLGVCKIANYNSPQQLVISGQIPALEAFLAQASHSLPQSKCVRLPVSGPFHTPLMAPAQEEFCKTLTTVSLQNPVCPVISNASAQVHTRGQELAQNLAQHMTAPVKWVQSLHALKDLGVHTVVEVGSGKVLAGLARKTIPQVSVLSVGTLADLELCRAILCRLPESPPSLSLAG